MAEILRVPTTLQRKRPVSHAKFSLPLQEFDTPEQNLGLNRGVLLKLVIHSDPNLLCVVRGAMERLTEGLGFSAAECGEVVRAVDEALTNIIRHTYLGRVDRPITIYCRRRQRRSARGPKDGLEVLLCDCGPAVDRAKLCGRPLDKIRPGGLGLHFIRQAMDTVEFTRSGRMNRLLLVKYPRPKKCEPLS